MDLIAFERKRTHYNRISPTGYSLGIDHAGVRFQSLDAMLDWLAHLASISRNKP